ncbi:helix-turn-helix domain-containing protein [Fructilactobacillus sanfranciscensis]|uniref:helix-turn-helix domain-containing protein n=1 Tax=Fructilactobacillus sanfranciscensis TaxID=1625 RepID=UPI0013D2D8F6|nr:helix-turn-helix domain-containing protein [Fructilactobacillus sanfranciscensis]WED57662.1 helix-turn-helix domain-containing protein [Fructilactobacillus sanfranciscensis]
MYSLDEKLAALNDFHSGISRSEIMKKYNIKGSATISEWIRRMDQFGIDGLVYKHEKTKFDYSFKIRVIKWRLDNQSSYPNAARHFKIRNPTTIYSWERDYLEGRLNSRLERPLK